MAFDLERYEQSEIHWENVSSLFVKRLHYPTLNRTVVRVQICFTDYSMTTIFLNPEDLAGFVPSAYSSIPITYSPETPSDAVRPVPQSL